MRVVFISKSDNVGGAAIVTRRLVEALRNIGTDATMLVAEKHTNLDYVHQVAGRVKTIIPFLCERMKIWLSNGLQRKNLFTVDAADFGQSLWRHPLVKSADVVCLEWFNQGLLSLNGIKKIARLQKPLVWVMHDQWPMTGICHLPGKCSRWLDECGCCPKLNSAQPSDLSHRVFLKKRRLYPQLPLTMVAVSNYLKKWAGTSPLLGSVACEVIPNPFHIPETQSTLETPEWHYTIAMGAARLDEPGKGFSILIEALRKISLNYPDVADRLSLVTFGGIKDAEIFERIPIYHKHLGVLNSDEAINGVFADADIVVSPSHYESLPTTLIEGMAAGCVAVSFNKGGQSDIVDHLTTGYLLDYYDSYEKDTESAGEAFAQGLMWAVDNCKEISRSQLRQVIIDKFSPSVVARRYLSLFERIVSPESF